MKKNNTIVTTENDNNITATTTKVEDKKYTLYVMFHTKSAAMIENTIKDNNIPYSIKTDSYVTIVNIGEDDAEKYKELFRKCSVSSSDGTKTYRVRFGMWKYKATTTKTAEHNSKKHTTNTPETAAKAKAERKAKKALVRHQKSEYSANRNELKKDAEAAAKEGRVPVVGRNAKKLIFRASKHKFKSTARVCPGTKENNLQKKLRKRAEKACRYIVKQEKKESVRVAGNAHKTTNKKATQLELPLAA